MIMSGVELMRLLDIRRIDIDRAPCMFETSELVTETPTARDFIGRLSGGHFEFTRSFQRVKNDVGGRSVKTLESEAPAEPPNASPRCE